MATPLKDKKRRQQSKETRRTGNLSIFLSFLLFPTGVKLRIRADEQGNEATLYP
jgi:hypothetical protein